MTFLQKLRQKDNERCPLFGLGDIKSCDLGFKGCEIAGEVGEAVNVIKKILRGDTKVHDKGVEINIIEALKRELADVVICADLLAAKFDIDLEEAVVQKFNKTSIDRGYNVFMENTPKRFTKIYLAIPYSQIEKESSYRQATLATQILVNEGFNVFSPITHSHPLAKLGTKGTWDYWQNVDYDFIDWADELYVLVPEEGYESVEKSIGVQAELVYATKEGKPIKYIQIINGKIEEYGRERG